MKKHNIRKKIKIIVVINLIILSSFSFMFLLNNNRFSQSNPDLEQHSLLKINAFSKDDYSSILQEEKSGLGEISVLNISFHQPGLDNSSQFNELDKDIGKDLNITYDGTSFEGTMVNASRNYLKEGYINNDVVRIKLNETLLVKFDNTTSEEGLAGFLVYLPRLTPIEILEIYVEGLVLTEDEYSIVNDGFLKFDYFDYFDSPEDGQFSMNIIYSYDLNLINWKIDQLNIDDLIANQSMQNFTAKYAYTFLLKGNKFSGNLPTSEIEADNLNVNLLVSPFDHQLLNNFSLALNSEQIDNIEDYQVSYGKFNISLIDSFSANSSSFHLNFTSNFVIAFQDPVSQSWAIDRLVSGNNIRERIYFPQILEGPEHLLLKFTFYEETIEDEQITDIFSQFNRIIYHLPISEIEEPNFNQGILVYTPSLIFREHGCPFTIRYEATNELRIIITDNINMPLWNLDVQIFYYNQVYGTYISNNFTQPIAPLVANENGEIILRYLPNGEYKIDIFRRGIKIKSVSINTEQETHYISTNVIHFPSVILSFGLISIIILLIGFFMYLRNKKVS
ncbi:MAG: hypothetical protein EU539_10485 [Promethearchaeota archaeon]|nr:MAG: hypothetical protein EU539_10485 [Candidatus Lokiarchaeota archaeon]